MQKLYHIILFILSILLFSGCNITSEQITPKKHIPKPKSKPKYIIKKTEHSLRVTATAYTSRSQETDKTPYLAAWNNRLRPGVKSIAVSRDLLKMGLTNGAKVRISGLKGKYTVLDKMNKRWRKKIDIYMGLNRKRAIRWGKRSVKIFWGKKSIILSDNNHTIVKKKKLVLKTKPKDKQTPAPTLPNFLSPQRLSDYIAYLLPS